MKRTRTCTSPPPKNRGKNCSTLGAAEETKSCFLTRCPIHGGFTEWSMFSNCSKSCGAGIKRRSRKCSNPEPKHGGRNCSRLGLSIEVKKCNTHPCPINGGYSIWTEFSSCTVTCGNGTRQRSRFCSNPSPRNGGRNCSHLGPNIEVKICNTNLCPIHGGFSEWTKFSECTKSCGNGTKTKTRNCSNPEPQHGGNDCSRLGSNSKLQQCNTHHCPINGGYTQWTEFSECTKSCENGTKTRTRNCSNPAPQHGGKNCSSLGSNTELQQCNTHHCPINGAYTPWTEFSECTKSCENGTKTRTRNCSNPEPQHGGKNCSHLGVSVEVQRCFLLKCPVHGGFTEWTTFSACSRTCGVGLKNRTRYCTNPEPMHGGDHCIGDGIQFKVCNVFECPINGGYTQWSAFSACSKTCSNGTMRRTRNCSNPVPGFRGNNCSSLGPAEEIKECNTFPCPVDGNYSAWSNFSICSKSCGNGTIERRRTCSNPEPQHGGRNCSIFGPSKEIRSCNVFSCPVHGNFSSWSIFTVCSKSCGNGTKTRTRNCSNPFPEHGGRNCSLLGLLKEVISCNVLPCPVHGNYSSWSNFSSCSKSCGNGTNIRTRNCSNPTPQHGGNNCSLIGPSVDVGACNVHPCPIDGGYTTWSEFTKCSTSCGRGTTQRTRNCTNPVPQYGGRNCSSFGLNVDVKECYLRPCPIDGGYSEWTRFSKCTRSCNGGKKKRWRLCKNPVPRHGGSDCLRLGPASEVQMCNTAPCPVHGGYSEWTGFEACTRTCGGGMLIRRRNCTSPPPAYGGRNCSSLGPSIESVECNIEKCPGWLILPIF